MSNSNDSTACMSTPGVQTVVPATTTACDDATESMSGSAPAGTSGDASGVNDDSARAILNMLGLAARSRRIVVGTDAVIAAVRSKVKPYVAAVASDASERSRKQIADKCAFNGVTLITLAASRAELAAAVGKKNAQCSVCAVTDRNMAKKIDILYHG